MQENLKQQKNKSKIETKYFRFCRFIIVYINQLNENLVVHLSEVKVPHSI